MKLNWIISTVSKAVLVTNLLVGQHTGYAEIIFYDMEGVDIQASTEGRFAIDNYMNRNNNLNNVTAGASISLDPGNVGFNYPHTHNDNNSPVPDIGYGVYKLTSDFLPTFYIDTRHCDYWPAGLVSGTPDLMIKIESEIPVFSFGNWPDTDMLYPIDAGMTIYLSWAWLDHEVVNSGNVNSFGNPSNYYCYEAPITFTQKYDTETLSGIFEIPELSITLISGGLMEEAGYYQLRWNGRNKENHSLSSGMYIIQMMAKSMEDGELFTKAQKIVLMK